MLLLGHKYNHEELKEKAFEEIMKNIPKLKDELMNEPEKLKDLIEVWKEVEEAENDI